MRVVDIRAIAKRARAAGARTAVDNTFLSPALRRPIALGADLVIHSTTKFLNGHSDVVGGAIIAADRADLDELADWAKLTRVTGAPFDAYLTLRGLRTLFPRIERQQATACCRGKSPPGGSTGQGCPLSRPGIASRARHCESPTGEVRRHAKLRASWRRCGC
jgi:O-acetylhomoserine/O-acetylserine sulfhydrylase-like pyridoxal-dependent enzyme